MTRWEHLVRGLPSGPPEAIEAWLNAHGAASWELVSIDWTARLAVMRRPRWRQTPIVDDAAEPPQVRVSD